MKGRRNFLWLAPFVLVASGPLWWSPIAAFLKPRGEFNLNARSPQDKIKTFALEEVVLTQSRGNRHEMTIHAQRLETVGSDERLRMHELEADLYGKEGDKVHVVSGEGSFETGKQKLTLFDNVKLTAEQGYTMYTAKLIFLAADKKLLTDDEVHFTGGNMDIIGKGMSYEIESGFLQLGGRVFFKAW